MTENVTSTVLDSIATYFEVSDVPAFMTAYKLSKVTNEVLKAVGIKTIPPQMIYNYVAKGLIKAEVVEGQNLVSKVTAEAWLTKYISRKLA